MSYAITALCSIILTIIFIRLFMYKNIGSILIDNTNPEEERWRLVIEENISKTTKKIVLKVDRETKF